MALLELFFVLALAQDFLSEGQRAFQAGDLAAAEAAFRKHLAANPGSAEALSNLAAVHSRRGQFTEAAGLYRQALKADRSLTPVHFNLSVALIQLRDYAGAASHLRLFLKAHPAEARARQLLGLCLVETGDVRPAVEELEAAYAANPGDPSIVFSLAYAHARAGNEQRSLHFVGLSGRQPALAPLVEGLIEYRRGRFAEARALLERAVQADPGAAPALAALGRLHLLENDDQTAISYLERAVKLNPQDAESVYQLGVLYDRGGQSEKGREFLRRALTLRAAYADPHYQLGRIAFRDKRYQEALAELEKAAAILPDQEAIRLLLGRTYQALGRAAEAKREFAEVRRLKQRVVERDRLRLDSDALMQAEAEAPGSP